MSHIETGFPHIFPHCATIKMIMETYRVKLTGQWIPKNHAAMGEAQLCGTSLIEYTFNSTILLPEHIESISYFTRGICTSETAVL